MWSGSIASIPLGFVLCDGNNGTPDLRDKFVVGAKQDDGGVAKTNLTGGLTVSGGNINHLHTVGYDATGPLSAAGSVGVFTNNDATPPPYYALAYIMKT